MDNNPTPAPAAPRKSWKKRIVIILVILLLVACCCLVFFGAGIYLWLLSQFNGSPDTLSAWLHMVINSYMEYFKK